jgi:hypothetical protein
MKSVPYYPAKTMVSTPLHSNTDSDPGRKVFGKKRNYRSDTIGIGVRLKSELLFELGRILQAAEVWHRYRKQRFVQSQGRIISRLVGQIQVVRTTPDITGLMMRLP